MKIFESGNLYLNYYQLKYVYEIYLIIIRKKEKKNN